MIIERSTRSFVSALASSALVLAACQATTATGAACSRASDCASPLVCGFGRCRVECAQNRDCGAGRLCLLDAGGQGSCSLDSDACTSICGAGLMCVAGTCVQPCSGDGDCPLDGQCATGSCVRGPERDAGDGSDAGASHDAGGRHDAGTIFCTHAVDCPSGQVCGLQPLLDTEAVPLCRQRCTSSAQCPPHSGCTDSGEPEDGGLVGACTTVCNPVTGDGCPMGTTCSTDTTTDVTGATVVISYCRLAGTSALGCACNNGAYECVAGLSCRHDAVTACAVQCVMGTNCDDGSPCESSTPTFTDGTSTYGYCPVPACS